MIDQKAVNRALVDGLQGATARPVVKQDSAGRPPERPYLSFTIISQENPLSVAYGDYGDAYCGTSRQIWSVTAQAASDNEALALAASAQDWLTKSGRLYLADHGITVQRLSGIASRTTVLHDGYEYRYGFDLTLALDDTIEKTAAEQAEVIRAAGVEGGRED